MNEPQDNDINDILYFDIQSLGLCNQLYCLACALIEGKHNKKSVAVKGFYPDMTSKECVTIETLLDLEKTNANLIIHNTKLVNSCGAYIKADFHSPDPQRRAERPSLLRSLVFAEKVCNLAASLCGDKPYYCVHFRLDIDAVLYYRCGSQAYFQWIGLIEQNKICEAREIAARAVAEHRGWILDQVAHYANAVKVVCSRDLPVIVLTSIGKPVLFGLNDTMEWAFVEFQNLLAPRTIVRNSIFPSIGREYSAAVELNIACGDNCVGFIATNGSTFSATINARLADNKKLYIVSFSDTLMPVY